MKRDFLRRVSPPAMGDEGWKGCEEDIVDRGVVGGAVVHDESMGEHQRFERQGLGTSIPKGRAWLSKRL
jgi:hypothetical protein